MNTFLEDNLAQGNGAVNTETLRDPDADKGDHPIFEEDALNLELVSAIAGDDEIAKAVSALIKPSNFPSKIHSLIVEMVFRHLREYGQRPSRAMILNEIKERYASATEGRRTAGLIEADLCLEAFQSGMTPRRFLIDKCRQVAVLSAVKKLCNDGLDGAKKPAFTLSGWAENIRQANEKLQIGGSDQYATYHALDYFEYAKTIKRVWVISDWINSGSTHLIAGRQKIGKSTLLMSMIPPIISGCDWFGLPTIQGPVIYLDWENPPDYIAETLLAQADLEEYALNNSRLFIPKTLPPVLSEDWLRGYVKQHKIQGPGVIFADSATCCFSGLFPGVNDWTNKRECIKAAILPIANVCRETGLALVLIHHENAAGTTAGSTYWEGSVDYVWQYKAEENTRQLRCPYGHYVGAKPAGITFEKPERRLIAVESVSRQEQAEKDHSLFEKVKAALPVIPLPQQPTAETAMTVATLATTIGGLSENTLRKGLETMVGGMIQRQQLKVGKTKAYHYYRIA